MTIYLKKKKTRTQPEPGFGSTEGKAVSISLFATNRLWVVNVFTLMWNSFLQAADSCMQKRSLGAVWEQLVCGPTVGCLLLLGGCYGAGRSHWVLRWCWGTFEGRRTEAFFHLPCHTPIDESRTENTQKQQDAFSKLVYSQRSTENVYGLFSAFADVITSLSERHPLPPGFAHFIEVTQHQ